ncbi:MAG: hypothetical protein M1819_001529 [Sarea resinae]|nr:MAG: hypothetical protein M1819_001529 [Sarea resinae]
MEQSIPGYFYDKEKKKYFKILPHHAAPAGSQYTKENVKKLKDGERKRKRDGEHAARLQRRVQRSKAMGHPIVGALGLEREQGRIPVSGSGLRWGEVYARELDRRVILDMQCLPSTASLTRFAIDSQTGAIVFALKNHLNEGDYNLITAPPEPLREGFSYFKSNRCRQVMHSNSSPTTSLNIGPTRTLVQTSLGDATESSSIHLTKLIDRTLYDGIWIDVGVHMILRPPNQTSVFTSATSKVDGDIAIGTSSGINLLQETTSNWDEQQTVDFPSDVLALEFLSPTIIAAGLRDSTVRLYDQRSAGKALRLRHSSSVTGIKQVDEFRVVVCGIKSSLRLYDLRYQSSGNSSRKRNHSPSTLPVYDYPHNNEYRLDLGFDVDTETGLIAAATEDKRVQIFSLHTGERLASPAFQKPFQDFPTAVQFATMSEEKRDDSKSLVVAAGGVVEECKW